MGYAKLPLDLKESLKREKSRSVRKHQSTVGNQCVQLIESFSRRDVERYEHLYQRWGCGPGGINLLFEKIQQRGITSGPIYELAKLRTQDRYLHQKTLQMLRYRWTNYQNLAQQRINEDIEKFWERMAKRIINRGREAPRFASRYWKGKNGLKNLIQHLKDLWHKQNGRCAESGLEMILKIGPEYEDKCSPDRIDSSRGYDPDNVRLVCFWVNNMKMDTPQNLFEQRIKILYESISQRIS